MKLCKDCKHSVWPIPGASFVAVSGLRMCGHPDAPRSLVDGALQKSCHMARGEDLRNPATEPCGPDAKLFEKRPPKTQTVTWSQLMDPNDFGSSMGFAPIPSRPWWRRIFGG